MIVPSTAGRNARTIRRGRAILWVQWMLVTCVLAMALGCAQPGMDVTAADPDRRAEREQMVREQIAGRGIDDPRVLDAMRRVPRHAFVEAQVADRAYDDRPLPIGHAQTISQPYIVAQMTELVRPQPGDRALEIGTGSGYQAAVLADLVAQVYTIEIVAPLATQARTRLQDYRNVLVRAGDGYAGWPEHAPFDIIMLTAAPERIPAPLLQQLAPGGRLIAPVGP